MTDKLMPTESIEKIKKGAKDNSGNIIQHVLASGNEYAIYEIDDDDINNRLRVYISGHTTDSEQKIIKRFIDVKQKYIIAKGLLYRSTNFGTMKNRIAHALASTLSTDEIDGVKEFEVLIDEINKEYKKSIINRFVYIIPVFLITLIMSILIIVNMDLRANNLRAIWICRRRIAFNHSWIKKIQL